MRKRSSGFGLLEVVLVFVMILIAGGVVLSLATHAGMNEQAYSEGQFIQTAALDAEGAFPNHNYAGLANWWNLASSQKRSFTVSPNGYTWGLKPFQNNGDCTSATCPGYWFTYYYRDGEMPEEVCQRLVLNLSHSFFINTTPTSGIQVPVPYTVPEAAQLCSRAPGGGAPLFLSIIKPF